MSDTHPRAKVDPIAGVFRLVGGSIDSGWTCTRVCVLSECSGMHIDILGDAT